MRVSLQSWEELISIEINEDPSKLEQAKAIYLEFTIARDSATINCVWQRLTGGQGPGKLYNGKKGKASICPDWGPKIEGS